MMSSIRVVCISDTHLQHCKYPVNVPDGDILIHAGDATFEGKVSEIWRFTDWFEKLPHRHKVFVAGNHDWLFQQNQDLARSMLPKGVIYLQDNLAIVEGLRIWGSPWQPEFMNWAFNLPRGHRLREKWNMIPTGVDILVTHGPPLGILDLTVDGEHVGCGDMHEVVTKRVKPRLHVFGHIHHAYGTAAVGRTLFVNATVCDEAYKPVNAPVVVDMDPADREHLPTVVVSQKPVLMPGTAPSVGKAPPLW